MCDAKIKIAVNKISERYKNNVQVLIYVLINKLLYKNLIIRLLSSFVFCI